jgi:hypothetical protein
MVIGRIPRYRYLWHKPPSGGFLFASLRFRSAGQLHGYRAPPERTPGERAPIMPDTIPLTYKELAEKLGLSPDSARIKAKRRKWLTVPGNHPSDPVRVLVPVEFLDPERSTERKGRVRTPSAPPANDGEINALREHLKATRDDLDRERTERVAERERLTGEIGRLNVELDRGRAELAEERRHGRDMAGHLDEAARLRQEIAAIRTELEADRRPWWRRMLGR